MWGASHPQLVQNGWKMEICTDVVEQYHIKILEMKASNYNNTSKT